MNSWKVILATVVIFGAGVFTGGLLVNYVNHSHRNGNHRAPESAETHPQNGDRDQPQRPAELPKPRQPDLLNTNFVARLDDTLKLTPDQRASIQKIIADGQERNRAIWTNNASQMRVVIQDVRHRIRETLTPDQQKQFEELMRHAPRHQQNPTNPPPALSATNSPASSPAN